VSAHREQPPEISRAAVSSLASTGRADVSRYPTWYDLYGLRVCSDLPLPGIPSAPLDVEPDWRFRRVEPGRSASTLDGPASGILRCEHGAIVTVLRRGPTGAWFWIRSSGAYHILPGNRQVDVYPEIDSDDTSLGLVLASRISIFLLREMGYPTFHASAVLTRHGAVAFLGDHGQGKSTMAALFLRHGAALVADDVLPLRPRSDAIYGGPSVPMMKLWSETAEYVLDQPHKLPNLSVFVDKKLFRLDGQYPFVQEPVRLHAFYLLDRYDPLATGYSSVTIQRVSGRSKLLAFVDHTSDRGLLRPTDVAALLPVYTRLGHQAWVRRLRYPHGFTYQDAVYEQIMSDLAAQ
jgi:hypothetical protein